MRMSACASRPPQGPSLYDSSNSEEIMPQANLHEYCIAAAWPLDSVMLSAEMSEQDGCKWRAASISQQEKEAPAQPCSALLIQERAFTRNPAQTAAQLF